MNQPACNAMHSITGRAATGKTYWEYIRMLNGIEKSLRKPTSVAGRTLNTEHLVSSH